MEEEWVVHLHPDRCEEADGDGVDLRQVSQLTEVSGGVTDVGR